MFLFDVFIAVVLLLSIVSVVVSYMTEGDGIVDYLKSKGRFTARLALLLSLLSLSVSIGGVVILLLYIENMVHEYSVIIGVVASVITLFLSVRMVLKS